MIDTTTRPINDKYALINIGIMWQMIILRSQS